MKNIESAITTTLSTTASVYGSDGYLQQSGVTVLQRDEPDTGALESVYIIGGTQHVQSDVIHENGELVSLAAGWKVVL